MSKWVCVSASGDQEEVLDPLELELQIFVGHQTPVLGSKLWPVAQMGAISPVLLLLFPDWAAVGTLV